jgi:DNA repair exonuclease SbcCD ATPase subunit
MSSLSELRSELDQAKGQRKGIESSLETLRQQEEQLERDIEDSIIAQAIIQEVAQETQKELEYHISELCSLALSAVFDDPYELKLEFVLRRGKTEADIYFERDGEKFYNLLKSCGTAGGGAIDIACFGLRVALWSLSRPKTRNVMVLDEPFQHLKTDEANRRAIEMVKEISGNLGLQVIMVSDERVKQETIVAGADKVFTVRKRGKYSEVKEI